MGRFIPRGIEPQQVRSQAVWLLLLACGSFVAAPMQLFAQAADSVRAYDMHTRSFTIPFSMPVNDPRLEMLLHVSTDGQNYRPAGTARANDRRFSFTAPSDGCYYFIVQTRDPSGVLSPADLRTAPPDMRLRICVDTQSPIIEELTGAATSSGLPSIHWKINEPNLKQIWADYRSTGNDVWMPLLNLPLKAEGDYTWQPSLGGELEVRMQALDKADNRSEAKKVRLRAANNVAHVRPPQEPAGPGKVMHVRSKTFSLQYQFDLESIGPSRVASVDIWKLHQGRTWQKCNEKGTPQGPATITVDDSGRWGFRLIPCSGAGMKDRDPILGDAPDIWVEVDVKEPQVKVTNVTVIQETDGGYLTVYWRADDPFLIAMPITILLSAPQGGAWKPIAAELSNTGTWRKRTDDLKLGELFGDRYEFQLKVTAIDEAGNTGSDQWRDTVKVDLKIPRIKHIDVKTDGVGQQPYHPLQSAPSNSPMPGGSLPQTPTTPLGAGTPQRPPASTMNGTGGGFAIDPMKR